MVCGVPRVVRAVILVCGGLQLCGCVSEKLGLMLCVCALVLCFIDHVVVGPVPPLLMPLSLILRI
jgi:hypothetical protein